MTAYVHAHVIMIIMLKIDCSRLADWTDMVPQQVSACKRNVLTMLYITMLHARPENAALSMDM